LIILGALAMLAWFCSLYGLAGSKRFDVVLDMVG
jgi:hypothetical protein